MITRPSESNAYEFVVVASLRAHQLMGGCLPRLAGVHKAITMAQMEVAEGCVARVAEGEHQVPVTTSPAELPEADHVPA